MKKRYGLTKGFFYKERSNKNNNKHSKGKNNNKENGVSLGFRIGNLVIFDYRKDYVAGSSAWEDNFPGSSGDGDSDRLSIFYRIDSTENSYYDLTPDGPYGDHHRAFGGYNKFIECGCGIFPTPKK